MRVFAAIVLGVAALMTLGLLIPVFLVPPAQGYNGIGELLLMLAAATLRWILLAILLGVCVRKGLFDWVPGGGGARRYFIVLGVHLVLGGLSVTSMLIVSDSSMLRSLPEELLRPMHHAAQLGCTLPAVATIACLAAINRSGPAKPPAVPLWGALRGSVVSATARWCAIWSSTGSSIFCPTASPRRSRRG